MNIKVEQTKEFELEEIIHEEINKLKFEIDMERKELEDRYNKLNVDELVIRSEMYSELLVKLRLLQSILCKYYDKQINRNLL